MYSHKTEVAIINNWDIFGDGNHESTQLVLDELYKQSPQNKDVLDVGCGTGIQSIFAKKWGANNVFAVDVDVRAIYTARKNFQKNNVDIQSRLNIYNEQLDFKADIIVANLPADCARDFLTMAPSSLKENGVIIISWPRQFNIYNECDLTNYEIVDRIEGIDYDAYAIKEK